MESLEPLLPLPEDEKQSPPINFKNLRLKPGQKVVLLDIRQFNHEEGAQLEWQDTLQTAFEKQGQGDWEFQWVTLPAGDTVLIAGILLEGQSPDADGLVPATIIAIAEEKWTIGDFLNSIKDGRFFGSKSPDDCEIKRITDAEPRDGQALLAYVEEGDVTVPVMEEDENGFSITKYEQHHEVVNQGIIDSLCRDWDIRTYQITKPELYAAKLATYARRWDHKPSEKRGLMETKRTSIEQQQKNLLSYAFRPSVVMPVLERFGCPGDAFLALKRVPFTASGNLSKAKTVSNPFEGIPYCGGEGLSRANTILWKKGSQTAKPKESLPEPTIEKPVPSPKNDPNPQTGEVPAKDEDNSIKTLVGSDKLNADSPVVAFDTNVASKCLTTNCQNPRMSNSQFCERHNKMLDEASNSI